MAIYYLDADDEITSAAARIRDSSDPRIALVLSGGSRVATSRINFRLLAGEAKHRNKRLAIIAADPTVQSVARSAQLPVYASVAEYENAEATLAAAAHGRPPNSVTAAALDELALTVGPGGLPARSTTGAPPYQSGSSSQGRARIRRTPRLLVAAIALVAVVAVAAAGFILYPSADVILTLRQDPVGPMTLSVNVDPNVAAANDQAGVVPGLNKAFSVNASGTYDATGVNVVETAAKGTVTFTSINTVSAVPVAAGTQISTAAGITFATTVTVTVPRATVSADYKLTPGEVDAPVQAVTKGTSGNVATGSIARVPSDLAPFQITVKNAGPTTGGTHTETPKVQQSDVEAAQADLWAQLEASFQTAIEAPGAVPSGSTMFAQTAKLGVATCNPDPSALAGQGVASFKIDCQDSGSVIVANMTSVSDLAKRRIRASVKTGYSLVESSVVAKAGTPEAQGSILVVPVTVQAIQVPVVDVNKLRSAIEGKSLTEARTLLAQYGKVEISLSPSWASTVPIFDFRVDIQVVVPEAKASGSPAAGLRASPSRAGGVNGGGGGVPTSAAVPTSAPATSPATAPPSNPAAVSPIPSVMESPSSPPTPTVKPSSLPSPTGTAATPPSPTP
jgi:hypothetical protein